MCSCECVYLLTVLICCIWSEVSLATLEVDSIEEPHNITASHPITEDKNNNNETDNVLIERLLIDELREFYIGSERRLWHEINSEIADKENVNFTLLDQIRIEHLEFFLRDFHEYAIDLNLFVRFDEMIFDDIAAVNTSIELATKEYLVNREAIRNELKTILIAQDHLKLNKLLDDLFICKTLAEEYLERVSVYFPIRHFKFIRWKRNFIVFH